jgi:hypothetical protein
MLVKSLSDKYPDIKLENVTNIRFDLANTLGLEISKVFIYEGDTLIHNYVGDDLTSRNFQYKILNSACGVCLAKPTLIIGDCKYCAGKYCGKHRLPEEHYCSRLDDCKQFSRSKNTAKLMAESLRTVKV